ncbi:hypothetical protein [Amorphus orientalis]|uniref:Uncharacterized protein n=1 Tax=Amorphus orientalis TaxID=649198 RepID=A0AAE4ATL7_9HYPH|nr:hypothetical protein [Amorphus orientalis]MDQ0316438.1 hypothetical protein [Amorphus orientalis]
MLNELMLGRALYCRRRYRHGQVSETRWAHVSRATQEWIRARFS